MSCQLKFQLPMEPGFWLGKMSNCDHFSNFLSWLVIVITQFNSMRVLSHHAMNPPVTSLSKKENVVIFRVKMTHVHRNMIISTDGELARVSFHLSTSKKLMISCMNRQSSGLLRILVVYPLVLLRSLINSFNIRNISVVHHFLVPSLDFFQSKPPFFI